MTSTTILILVGSLRAASINRQLAEVATQVTPAGVTAAIYPGLGDLPHYNEDIDTADAPAAVAALRAAADDADAALVVTPEYNGTIPGVLKNAIDWLSRPYGSGALTGKPLAVIGTNSIAAYLIAHLWEGFIERALVTHLGTGTFQSLGAGFEPLLKGAAILLVLWLFLAWMYQRKIFLRV